LKKITSGIFFHTKKYTIEHRKRNEGSIKFYEKKTFRKEEQIGMCEKSFVF
jgi:hypothetical protein